MIFFRDQSASALFDLLGITEPSDQTSLIAALEHRITIVLAHVENADQIEDVRAAKRWADGVRSAADRLYTLLAAQPSQAKYLSQFVFGKTDPDIADPLLRGMQNLRQAASQLAECEQSLRSVFWIEPSDRQGSRFISRSFWPELFEIYKTAGHTVGYSTKGRLFRFVDLIHEVAGLEPPKEGTLKDAIRAWKESSAGKRSATAEPATLSFVMKIQKWKPQPK